MLLPSAFSCEGPGSRNLIPQRPKLPSFGAFLPQQQSSHSVYHARPRPSPLSSSCRALQAILGTPSVTIPQPAAQDSRRKLSDPFVVQGREQEHPFTFTVPSRPRQIHRNVKKRRRSEFERDSTPSESLDIQMDECPPSPRAVRTPKRRRRIPLSVPMGLCADDFRALETPFEEKGREQEEEELLDMPVTSPQHVQSDRDSAYGSSPSIEDAEWTVEDDRILVETVLEKFKLSKREWNDCARILGKDRDSLGRRWSLLVGEGHVGLRRGGRMSRTNLDISSW
ncbi:hypothetical protein A1O1_08480 [Capronia coronata CBS 617.96]|uniref:Myb-like domain-containing protein n=1 Tax=Capronia coronata CBS 617.96 TaxID=1182541 RepID=W9XTP4_9EURO|nr:uncharacterized protein A1O1_08480 [Capronia coronata CBS 617.96]EXJ80336.1 hypothetical protein A1O1_08480 [Capronia coronata CBS 617.96]